MSGFIMAVAPNGDKRLVPEHYLENPAFGFKLPPSARIEEPTEGDSSGRVEEPAGDSDSLRVEEPATPETATPNNVPSRTDKKGATE